MAEGAHALHVTGGTPSVRRWIASPRTAKSATLGPDHPQIEIYNESKHGIQFRANVAKMTLDSKSWIVGKVYSAAPTCATCHMSPTGNQSVTHDVGDRISFTILDGFVRHTEN